MVTSLITRSKVMVYKKVYTPDTHRMAVKAYDKSITRLVINLNSF